VVLGLAAAGGVGYYLYHAGGKPKVAEKKIESDVHKAAADIKSQLPGYGIEAEKEGKKLGQEIGSKVDSAFASADKQFSKAKSDGEAFAKGAKADAMKKLDEIDRKVEEGTAKAKSSVSSWFGGK